MNSTSNSRRFTLSWDNLVAATAAFVVYFAMYGLRKPFTAAEYAGLSFLGSAITLKTALIVGQVIGYVLSKILSVRICSSLPRAQLWRALAGLGGAAQTCLLLFAVLPQNWKVVAIFGTGLCLGMVWALVVRYLEGRTNSDLMMAILCCSFIISSGVVKDVGRLWMVQGVPEYWMPFVTGLCFLPAFVAGAAVLHRLPGQSADDVRERTVRHEMDQGERRAFLWKYSLGLVPLFVCYMSLTAVRDYRDNFAPEMLAELGYQRVPGVFTILETPTAVLVTVCMGLLVLVKNHRQSLMIVFACVGVGALLFASSAVLCRSGLIDGLTWMCLSGLGVYLAYVPFNAIVFERIMSLTRSSGTSVFAIGIADSLGYLGSFGAQIQKDLLASHVSREVYFGQLSLLAGAVSLTSVSIGSWFFLYQIQFDKKRLTATQFDDAEAVNNFTHSETRPFVSPQLHNESPP